MKKYYLMNFPGVCRENATTFLQRLNAFPYSSEDVYWNKCDNLSNLAETIHENCYDKCQGNYGLAMMSLQEGYCYRNCITKYVTWFPTIKTNLREAPYKFHEQKLIDNLMENDSKFASANTDPWADRVAELQSMDNKQF